MHNAPSPTAIHVGQVLASPAAAVPLDLRTLQTRIEQIIFTCPEKHEAIQEFLAVAQALTNAADVAYTMRNQQGELRSLALTSNARFFKEDARRHSILQWAAAACETASVQLDRLRGDDQLAVVTLPVYVDGDPLDALTAALVVRGNDIEPFIVSLQLVASAIGRWYASSVAASNEYEAQAASAIIELLGKCNLSENLAETSLVLVNELQRYFSCDAVALALCPQNSQRPKVVSISGSSLLDQRSDLVKRITATAFESLDRGKLTTWPPLSIEDKHASRVHRQLVDNTRHEAVISAPLEVEDKPCVGAWVFLGSQARLHDPQTLDTIVAAGPHVASTLALRKQADAGPWERVDKLLRGTPTARRRRRGALIACLAATVILALPFPHKIKCDCTIEPSVRRFAVVPFDGLLRDSFASPGDMVRQDDVLARMDDREMRFERSELVAERTRSLKERDVRLSAQEVAAAQIATLKAKELEAKLQWLQHREANLEIKSPIDGVVLSGDLEDAQGAPVQTGQLLFEVAPLDSLKIQLAVPEEDLTFVKRQMKVTARLEGAPGRKMAGRLARITPRATAEGGKNVFPAEVEITEFDDVLRPGMNGTARVIGPRRPLGWLLFHKAYRRAVDLLAW